MPIIRELLLLAALSAAVALAERVDSDALPSIDQTIEGQPCQWDVVEEAARRRRGSQASEMWSVCGAPSDHLHWRHVKVDPEKPQRGDNMTIEAHAVLDEELSSGYVHVEIKLECTTIFTHVYDLCQVDPNNPCPIPHGKVVVKRTFTVPSDVPKGHYHGTIRATDHKENQVTCVAFDLTL